MREEVVGHDFCKRKLLTQTHHIQNFASQSGLRPPHLSSELCFAKLPTAAASFFAVHWSKHFATQNGLRPPRFLRGAYFAVHWSKHFATQNGLLSKFCYAKPPIQNFASQSGLRPPHHGQSILLRKTVCDRPVFFGVHTLRFIKGLT